MKKRSKSGFTLVEMVIVLVIIGILASILIPTWNYFITRSKVTTQNNNARVVFNAAQTECIKYKFRDRELTKAIADNTELAKTLTGDKLVQTNQKIAADKAKLYFYNSDGSDFYFYWDGKNGYSCDSNLESNGKSDDLNEAFASAINGRIETPDDVVYKIHIKDYKVMSVVCAKHEKDRLVGSYPEQQGGRSSSNFKKFDFADAEHETTQTPEPTTVII